MIPKYKNTPKVQLLILILELYAPVTKEDTSCVWVYSLSQVTDKTEP